MAGMEEVLGIVQMSGHADMHMGAAVLKLGAHLMSKTKG